MKKKLCQKNDIITKFVKERIEENKNLFSKKELNFINNNFIIIKKIYLLGIKNYINIIK